MEGVGAFVAGAIVGKLILDKKGWSAAISEVKKDQSTLAGMGKVAAQGINLIGKAIVTVGLTAAYTLRKMVTNYVEAGDAVYEMSLRTGISTETLSEFSYMASLCGVSTQEMERSWKKMATTITDARRGNEGAIQTFRDMNLNFVDLIGLKLDQQFMMIGTALAKMTDETKESNAAQEVFGRTGIQMNTIFKEGPEAISKYREEARKLGLVYTKDMAEGADKAADAHKAFHGAMTGLSMAIVERLIPAVTAITSVMTDALVSLRSKSGEITEAVISTFVYMIRIIEGVGLAFMGLKAIVFYTAEYVSKGLAKILGWEKTVFDTLGKVFPYFKKSAAGLQVGIDALTFASDEYAKSCQGEIDKMTGFIIGVDAIIAKVRELTKVKKESAVVPVIPVGEALPALPPGRDVSGIIAKTGKAWSMMTSVEQAALMQLSKDFAQEEMMLNTLDQAWQRAVGSMGDRLTSFGETAGGVFGMVAGLVKGFIGEMISSLGKMIIAEQLAAVKTVIFEKVKAIAKAVSSVFSKFPFPLNLALAAVAIGAVTALFSKILKFEKGGLVPETGLAVVHKGEYINPAAEVAGGAARFQMVFAPVFNISALDPMTTRDVVREKIGPELLDMLMAKILQADFRKALGVRT